MKEGAAIMCLNSDYPRRVPSIAVADMFSSSMSFEEESNVVKDVWMEADWDQCPCSSYTGNYNTGNLMVMYIVIFFRFEYGFATTPCIVQN